MISGRLRIVLERDGAEVRTACEVGRESIGEMALITGEQRAPRSTPFAIRKWCGSLKQALTGCWPNTPTP